MAVPRNKLEIMAAVGTRMKETAIRGKVFFYGLFAVMLLFSIKAQERRAVFVVQEKADREEKQGMDALSETAPRVALTFDDGPHPKYTKQLLDGLKERGVKATFFVIGNNIAGREELIRQMYKDGHIIGNHTFNHVDISKLSSERACEELMRTSLLVEEITGSATPYVRPPFGNWNKNLDSRLSMIQVNWTVDPLDWTTENTSEIVEKVVTQAEDNAIILLHDYYRSSVEAALQIIDILSARGFVFVTVEELLLE